MQNFKLDMLAKDEQPVAQENNDNKPEQNGHAPENPGDPENFSAAVQENFARQIQARNSMRELYKTDLQQVKVAADEELVAGKGGGAAAATTTTANNSNKHK
eukprot:TRINITY_DN1644_c0_g1_i1.p6 TRINITY_DN1644_c0_g1~~TRINITY_DN1644_c0_g1_i1.p6  ORF type:complete len:102 (-),score=28.49 TRINITY_DN1644_c0_g1_i1:1180-1485(-)